MQHPLPAARAVSMTYADRAWVGLIAALALAICLPAARELTYLFGRVEFYAHGYLVPPVAGYLAFVERRALAAALRDLRPPPFGAPVVLLAGSLELLAVIGDLGFAAGLGIPVLLGATAWAVGGLPLLRPLTLPLIFLALMVPPPYFVTQSLLAGLKLLVTRVSVEILYRLGHTVFADGNRIEVPGHELFVADACSGLTSIVTLLPVACVVAYFLSHGWWRRSLVALSVVPLAMLANVGRVVGTVMLVSRVGPQAAQGLLHETFGLATYVVGTLALVLVARLLR